MKIVKINEKIFREYDVRGVYNIDINEDVSYTFGRSFGSYIKDKTVIIGHDNRSSSPVINNCLIKGLIESGCHVIDLGLVTTPMYYYAKKKNNIESGIMITASHNPKEYNGFKISFDISGNAYGKMIYDFRNFTNNGVFSSGKGDVISLDIKNDYLKLINDSISLGKKKIKLVIDCGNGTGESNSEFPNHQPDPAVKTNQIDLSKKVVELGYDYGFSIDGDADRVGIVDEKGNILASDMYLLLIYKYLSNTISLKKAIYDVKCSKSLIDELDKLGYEQTMYRTGNSYMNMKINKDNYMFGGEFSGWYLCWT